MAKILRNLTIREVSSVDRGAGEGVKVMLIKRDDTVANKSGDASMAETPLTEQTLQKMAPEARAAAIEEWCKRSPIDTDIAKADADGTPDEVVKRTFTAEQRRQASATGAAMPGGRYPIESKEDLHNAIRAVGRGKGSHAAIRAHIMSRARALGLTSELPDDWKTKKSWPGRVLFEKLGLVAKDGATDFNTVQAGVESDEYARGMIAEIQEAVCSLQRSVCSIMCDDECPDKQAALDKTFEQFQTHIQGVVPEGIETAMAAAGLVAAGYAMNPQGAVHKGDDNMATIEELTKQLVDSTAALETQKAETAKRDEQLAKLGHEIVMLKMSPKHKQYMADTGMSEEAQKAFGQKSDDERDDEMDKNPVKKAELPAEIVKALADAEDLRKQFADMQKANALVTFQKRAVAIGQPEAFGETLQKAFAGDKDAIETMVKALEAAHAQIKAGGLFKEFGSTQSDPGLDTAVGKMAGLVAEVRKADPKLAAKSDSFVRAKIAEMPQHREVWNAYKDATTKPNGQQKQVA